MSRQLMRILILGCILVLLGTTGIGAQEETPVVEPPPVVTDIPTEAPTDIPTDVPTEIPTEAPTDIPTAVPTDVPPEMTAEITEIPTDAPTTERMSASSPPPVTGCAHSPLSPPMTTSPTH
ncbi:MAG: hypothetical protein K8I60_06850 [Anaerolineae bacterium]|nr:hypothetical protein [Anaerolineae bacterium]